MPDANNLSLSAISSISRETLELMDGYIKKTGHARGRNARISMPAKGFRGQEELETFYATSDIAKKFVNYLVDEATRERVVFSDQNQERHQWLDRFDLWRKINRAWKDARLYGGSAIFLNVEGLPPEEPLTPDRMIRFRSFVNLNKFQLTSEKDTIVEDISSPYFEKPEFYMLQGKAGTRIHTSRLVIFDGDILPQALFRSNGYWHQSILEPADTAIKEFEVLYNSLGSIVDSQSLLIVKIKEFRSRQLFGDKKNNFIDSLTRHLEEMQAQRDLSSIFLCDADEDVNFISADFSSIIGILDKLKLRLQMATEMPATILFNESPGSSISNSGRSQQEQWYDFVKAQQEDYLSPKLDRLLEVSFKAKGAKFSSEDFDYTFQPLFQETAREKVENLEILSRTLQQIYSANIANEFECREILKLMGGDIWEQVLQDNTGEGDFQDPSTPETQNGPTNQFTERFSN
jgi:uncharacterized protein